MTRETMIDSISRTLARADLAQLRIVYQFVLHLVR